MPDLLNPAQWPVASGSEPFLQAFCMAGASQATASPKRLPVGLFGRLSRLAVNAPGRNLTLADTLAGVLFSSGEGQTALLLPHSTDVVNVLGVDYQPLGYAMSGSNPLEISFLFQRCGLGAYLVNPVSSKVVINWNGFDLQNLPLDHTPVRLALARTVAGIDYWYAG